MDPVDPIFLARTLIDIDSTTGCEGDVGAWLSRFLGERGYRVEEQPVSDGRFNVFASQADAPVVVLSTHVDCVPPFFSSREERGLMFGRGACDAKGILAAQIAAAERLRAAGETRVALLFVVGEERGSDGARAANLRAPAGVRYLVNGEPTDNRLGAATRGVLRVRLKAQGRAAHSAFPELGESAIDKLLDALERVRRMPLPTDPLLGPTTLNIGVISGGRAPNVVPDAATAEISIRLVDDPAPVREAMLRAVEGLAEAREILFTPAIRFEPLDGFETTVVAFTTDVPSFDGAWGQPFVLGPGNIHVAHTSEERVEKRALAEAAQIYQRMVRHLLAAHERSAAVKPR